MNMAICYKRLGVLLQKHQEFPQKIGDKFNQRTEFGLHGRYCFTTVQRKFCSRIEGKHLAFVQNTFQFYVFDYPHPPGFTVTGLPSVPISLETLSPNSLMSRAKEIFNVSRLIIIKARESITR